MQWRDRLRDLVLAGGAAAVAACSSSSTGPTGGVPCCNANPDPCCASTYCGAAVSTQCLCQRDGGTWSYFTGQCGTADAGSGDAAADADAHD
jgi:hypothetical protein